MGIARWMAAALLVGTIQARPAEARGHHRAQQAGASTKTKAALFEPEHSFQRHLARAAKLATLGRGHSARAELDAADQLPLPPALQLALARANERLGRYTRALALYRAVWDTSDNPFDAYDAYDRMTTLRREAPTAEPTMPARHGRSSRTPARLRSDVIKRSPVSG